MFSFPVRHPSPLVDTCDETLDSSLFCFVKFKMINLFMKLSIISLWIEIVLVGSINHHGK